MLDYSKWITTIVRDNSREYTLLYRYPHPFIQDSSESKDYKRTFLIIQN